ncbi:hypothetical protein H0E84_15595 [Luteimonas sp. SJ-92]|uniref:Uncharacterized protein n=1 Tax=Luteimonas salinisoli TaxID=2752307 RepID=A0A853JGG1_9GAMM|nr:hypothetical protein [Luteimonas salinisoli]NZA27802.1 hypothetical protein [Luteimonas salinisoli]
MPHRDSRLAAPGPDEPGPAQALGAMPKIRVALGLLLYLASCLGLLIAPAYITLPLTAYSADFVASHGPRIPAFSSLALLVMPRAWLICFSVLAASVVLAFLAFRKVEDRDTRLYWIGVLANINFYTVLLMFGMVLIGFFLLPRLANGV